MFFKVFRLLMLCYTLSLNIQQCSYTHFITLQILKVEEGMTTEMYVKKWLTSFISYVVIEDGICPFIIPFCGTFHQQ